MTIWYGAGKIVSSTNAFARKLRISPFSFSFLVLGIFTSSPEFAVGLTAISEHKPEIYMGNLIGGIPVLFLLAIPILAIFGNGLKLKDSISQKNLLFSFAVMLAPALFVLDGKVTFVESVIFVILYIALVFFIEREKGFFDNGNRQLLEVRSYSLKDIMNVIFGVALVFIAGHYIVEGTQYFASLLKLSTFFISLILLSLGTNVPELSLAIKAIASGKKDVAFGDYVGSGAANTLLFGLFGILNAKTVIVKENFLFSFIILCIGLLTFFFFARSKNELSRIEGIILVILFLSFGIVQLL